MNETRTGPDDALADLLCDLKHWCDRHNTSFYQELRRAEQHYREETRPLQPRAEVRIDPEAPTPYAVLDDEPFF